MNAHKTEVPEFAWREECCTDCGGSGMRGCMIGSGFVESECHGCGGEGSWSASCAECREERPLNGNGLCAECAALGAVLDLTVKTLGGERGSIWL